MPRAYLLPGELGYRQASMFGLGSPPWHTSFCAVGVDQMHLQGGHVNIACDPRVPTASLVLVAYVSTPMLCGQCACSALQ